MSFGQWNKQEAREVRQEAEAIYRALSKALQCTFRGSQNRLLAFLARAERETPEGAAGWNPEPATDHCAWASAAENPPIFNSKVGDPKAFTYRSTPNDKPNPFGSALDDGPLYDEQPETD